MKKIALLVSLLFVSACENGQLVDNAAQQAGSETSASIQIRRTLPEQLDSAVLKQIAREVETKGISHPQLEAMLRELDAIRQGRYRGSLANKPLAEKLANCGVDNPKLVSDLGSGAVLKPASIGDAALRTQVRSWVAGSVQPLANQYFGQPVRAVHSSGIYACRTINRDPTRDLSRHAYGLAIDVSGFTLADGTKISLGADYQPADSKAGQFLRQIDKQACRYFSTSLGPDDDKAHQHHFHLDLKYNASGALHRC